MAPELARLHSCRNKVHGGSLRKLHSIAYNLAASILAREKKGVHASVDGTDFKIKGFTNHFSVSGHVPENQERFVSTE